MTDRTQQEMPAVIKNMSREELEQECVELGRMAELLRDFIRNPPLGFTAIRYEWLMEKYRKREHDHPT